MSKWMPPEVIEKIRKNEEEKHRDNRVPLYLPDDKPTKNHDHEQEETSGIVIIDLVD